MRRGADDCDDRAHLRPAAGTDDIGVHDRDAEEEDRHARRTAPPIEQQSLARECSSSMTCPRPASRPRAAVRQPRPLPPPAVPRLHDSPSRRRCRSRRVHRHRHVETRVADDDRCFRRAARIGDRLFDHRRVRLGRMAVGGLERDEPGVDVMPSRQCLSPRSDLPVATASNQPSSRQASSSSITPSKSGSSTRPAWRSLMKAVL